MWVRLKTIQHIERQGKMVTYHPGDWVDLGKQQAMLLMSRGDAEIPSYRKEQFRQGEAGVIIRGVKDVTPWQTRFEQSKLNLTLIIGDPYIAFDKTMIYSPQATLRPELIGAGFSFLDTWEIAMPLYSYDELAVHIGSEAAQARTKLVIHDLRVPVLDTRLIFVRLCENTQRLFKLWLDENESGDDERLTFMRAYYEVKPLCLHLPVTWHTEHAYSDAA
jgi:hypothetical protein